MPMTPRDGALALILASDKVDTTRFQHALEELGYRATTVDETQVASRLLAEALEPIIVLFDVDLVGNAMAGLDHADLLGALLRDGDLVARHAFVAVSHDPANVAWVFGSLLDRLEVSLVGVRCTLDTLSKALDQALTHVGKDVAVS